jgi:hypothetical protein
VVPRPRLIEAAKGMLNERAFLQISGLPGSGKSAVLRQLAEERLSSGSVLVLKADRLEGSSWPTYAQRLGLATVGLEALLMEIAAAGTPVLFVDGLDRVEHQQRGIVLDVVNTILGSAALRAVWRVAATVRDNGIEPLRQWLPPGLMRDGGIATLPVMAFDEAEAEALATAKPELWPLLFGEDRVSDCVRCQPGAMAGRAAAYLGMDFACGACAFRRLMIETKARRSAPGDGSAASGRVGAA